MFKDFLKQIFSYKEQNKYSFTIPNDKEILTNNNIEIDVEKKDENVYSSLDVNLEHIKVKYNFLINSDINIREFTLVAKNTEYKAAMLYIDGLIDTNLVNDFILKPLMSRQFDSAKNSIVRNAISKNIVVKHTKKFNIEDYIINSLIPQNNVQKFKKFSEIIFSVNAGFCAIFIDTLDTCFCVEAKGFQMRSVSSANNEVVVRGSQEAFVEAIRTNTSMLRRIINNENLIIEESTVGAISKTKVAICYMKNITNNDLIAEVKYRINNLEIDYLISSGQLEQLIQDSTSNVFPQILATERPDKTANYILEGRIAIIVNGTPYSLIVPSIFIDFLASPEDMNSKHQYSNFLRFIRLLAMFFAIFLPGFYVAITNYHQELIPTELLFAVANSRRAIPFPVIFEILIMEISFELIREAGIRVPSPFGSTIGIIGALVLGEAAVSANIVSPILIIVVAFTGICAFTIPDYSLSFTLRIFRFMFTILGYLSGLLGIGFGTFLLFIVLSDLKSFGVSYFSPYIPSSNYDSLSPFFVRPIWKRERRSNFLNTKRPYKEEKISMRWRKNG